MSRKVGLLCLMLGIACLLSAVMLVFYNHWEENRAEDTSKYLLQDVQEKITDDLTEDKERSKNMSMVQVDGQACIGVLSIPVLELELPVLTDWSYAKLKIAPCHYYGTVSEKNFVIAAHNYQSHFGRLTELQPQDLIMFTEMSGEIHYYEVVLLETLPGNAVEEMITSGFDLSLYTCTVGGGSRVTVRCNALEK